MNNVRKTRVIIGKTQKEMADILNISETQYRAKENGQYQFKLDEMKLFYKEAKEYYPEITLENIFLDTDRRILTHSKKE